VKGLLHAVDLSSMSVVSTLDVGNPVFSSLTAASDRDVVFGCHDCRAYCVDAETCDIRWRLRHSSPGENDLVQLAALF
jgi:outer membrane protein assembly factor BamB